MLSFSCWINQVTWFDRDEKVRSMLTSLGIPANYKVCGFVCLGYTNGTRPGYSDIKRKYCYYY